jgi:hypothetical protein
MTTRLFRIAGAAVALAVTPAFVGAQDPTLSPRHRPAVAITADLVDRFLRAHAVYVQAVRKRPDIDRYMTCMDAPPDTVEKLDARIYEANGADDEALAARLEKMKPAAYRAACGAAPAGWSDANPYLFAERAAAQAGGFPAVGDYLLARERIDAFVQARRYERSSTGQYRFTAAERALLAARYAQLDRALREEG